MRKTLATLLFLLTTAPLIAAPADDIA
ncbi:MAG: hypothetical protein QOI58_779, partial [Thermoanaerobaculia bacterium]|nr:hypothetical protein [Thermoanaerobaculia bacterium]